MTESGKSGSVPKLRDSSILRIEDLYIYYHVRRYKFFPQNEVIIAVKGISFSIKRGETFAIVGESGSGKTSLVMSILGFVKPKYGKILFENQDIWSKDKKALGGIRKKIQPIFQDSNNALNPRMTIGEAIRDGFKSVEKDKDKTLGEKVSHLLGLVGLGAEFYDRFPHELSGGQKQRVCLARAMAPNPELIILDEPLSSQDLSIQANLINLLLDLKHEKGLTYLLISHDLWVVRSLADRIAVLKQGKIVEVGETEKLFRNPEHSYTQTLLAHMPGT